MVWPDAASFSSSSVGDALPCVLHERRCGGAAAAQWRVVVVLAAALCPQLAASVTVFVVIRAASTTTAVGGGGGGGGGGDGDGSTKAEPFPSSFLYSKAESIFYTRRDDEKRKPLVRATYSISRLRKR